MNNRYFITCLAFKSFDKINGKNELSRRHYVKIQGDFEKMLWLL